MGRGIKTDMKETSCQKTRNLSLSGLRIKKRACAGKVQDTEMQEKVGATWMTHKGLPLLGGD